MSNDEKIQEILRFLKGVNKLKLTPRYGSTLDQVGDSVAEHSWRLSVMTFLMAYDFDIKLDVGRAIQLALVHDLAEAKTGDIDAYDQITQKISKIQKKEMEDVAMEEMTSAYSFGEMIQELWDEYEAQVTLESKFIKALDKLEALLHLTTVGVEHYYKKADFYSSYADEVIQAFEDAAGGFPVLSVMLDAIKADLKVQFEEAGVEWKD